MGCRSFLQGWINPETGKDEEDGRMNLGVVTVNVPRIAIESHGDKARFWKLFDERMEVAHQALQFRIMRCKEATPVNAPTLFRFGAFGRLGANDNVDQLFKNERATVSLGTSALPRPLRSSMARTGFATTAGIRKARSSRCPSSSA